MNIAVGHEMNPLSEYPSLPEALKTELPVDHSGRILHHQLEAGEHIRSHLHPNAEETIYLISGRAEVQIGDKRYLLQAKSNVVSLTIKTGQVHSLDTDLGAEYFVVREGEEGVVYLEANDDDGTASLNLSKAELCVTTKSAVVRQVRDFPLTANVCQQKLKELWRGADLSSLAHVEMESGAVSLLHYHRKIAEVYFGLSGHGILQAGKNYLPFEAGSIIEIPAGTSHKLENTGKAPLIHLVICAPAFDPDDVVLLEELKDA